MKNTTYLIIGLIMGYFMAITGSLKINAANTIYDVGTKHNPMYVKVVN